MKIFINNRNWLTWPKAMAEKFSDEGHETIFIDNGSSYPPLLEYYESCPFQVIRLANLGNQAAWRAGIVTGLKEYYVLTDPDYDLSDVPSDWEEALMQGFELFPGLTKCGLSWDESRVPRENPAWTIDEFGKYPQGTPYAWGKPIGHDFYGVACDTSFAIYKPGVPFSISGIRKGRPYTGIHMPWHITLDPPEDHTKKYVLMNEEIYYYFTTVENSSYTHGRLQAMLKAYQERHKL